MPSDLHIHSAFSDGSLSPEEIIDLSKKMGLNYISITDHDTMDGISYLYENGLYPTKGLNIIPGVEMSAQDPTHELHIIGYNVDMYNRELSDKLSEVNEARWARFATIMEKLRDLGYNITEADVLSVAGTSKSVSRSHIARALVRKGFFPTVRETFSTLLEHGKPAYVPHYRLTAEEIIALIKNAGGQSVLAHPKLVQDDVLVQKIIDMGIDGLEVFYPQHDEADTSRYMSMAKAHKLLVSGGSDFHGFTARHAIELGAFTIDDEYAEKFFREE